jgi:hypothetical protein
MIADPLTLGITAHLDTFDLLTFGNGAKTNRLSSTTPTTGTTHVLTSKKLTISHETVKSRRRSLFRLDYEAPFTNATLGTASLIAPPSAYLVVDQPLDTIGGDRDLAVYELLSRIIGFLTNNATGAPDHTLAAQTKVIEWLRGEP